MIERNSIGVLNYISHDRILNFLNQFSMNARQLPLVAAVSLILFVAVDAQAQLKIGGDPATIDDGSILELESTNKAFVPPRMTSFQRDGIPTPLTGAIIYNLDLECLQVKVLQVL